MSVPTYDQFIEPILRYLAATPEGAAARDAHEAAADALNLSEAQRQELIASGQATYKNRAGWLMTASNAPACPAAPSVGIGS